MYKIYLSVHHVTVTHGNLQIIFSLMNGNILNRRKYIGIEKVDFFERCNPFQTISPDIGTKTQFERRVYDYLKNPTNKEFEVNLFKYIDDLNELTQ